MLFDFPNLARESTDSRMTNMKYLLTSSGLTTAEIVDECERLVGKDRNEISVAIINEAYAFEIGDKRWMIQEFRRISENFGGNVDLVDLLALNEEQVATRISEADVIYVIGGNTDYLYRVFLESKFEELLNELPSSVVYVGSSAGSMVLGKRLPSVARKLLFDGQLEFEIEDYFLHFDFAFLPHMDGPDFENCREDIVKENLETFEPLTYCLNDSQAMSVVESEIRFIGGKPLILQNGKVVD